VLIFSTKTPDKKVNIRLAVPQLLTVLEFSLCKEIFAFSLTTAKELFHSVPFEC